ncbi:hypothetical protein CHS0354_037938 [Potamilus streckersoni]|uniref:Tetratricopeptide repeat protein 37 n=1 Tax=Potamilus streckersoni TaxID=2493646 RepID=A0AAE0T9F9_9BIVA|nr:hypothetical protein CHS0354_037938 [Potamilus streckersoni]
MDGKEIRNTLKNAREAIRQKEFKEALKHCKTILSHDKDNYMALVLVGVAAEGLEGSDKAVNAYKRAIEIDEKQILAWQGLCSFYEKNLIPANEEELLKAYDKLIELYERDKQEEKQLETMGKLMQYYCKKGTTMLDKAVSLYRQLMLKETDVVRQQQYQQSIVKLLQQQKSLSADLEDLVLITTESILPSLSQSPDEAETMISLHISVLSKKNADALEAKCRKLLSQFPSSKSCLDHLLLIHMDRTVGVKPSINAEFETWLQNLEEDSRMYLASQGYIALFKGDYPKARSFLSQAVGKSKNCVGLYFYLGIAHHLLHDNREAEATCVNGLSALQSKTRLLTVSSTQVESALYTLQAKLLCEIGTPQTLQKALDIIQKHLYPPTPNIRRLQGLAYLKIGDIKQAEVCLSEAGAAGSQMLKGCIAYHQGQYEDAVQCFQEVLSSPEREKESRESEVLLMLIKCYWAIIGKDSHAKVKEICFTSLLQAAKLDPYCSETFKYLGHFYRDIKHDSSQARKCYKKSFELDPWNDEAGSALCDTLNDLGLEEDAHSLLLDVTAKASAGSAKWAWLRLGLYQVKHENPSTAVTSFQSALRADPNDNHVWECLAEAYLYRGSYTAALKAFTKSTQLDPDSMYSYFQIASIKQTLGLYTDAINEYKLLLDRSPNYVPALKGLGETYLLRARAKVNHFLDGQAKSNAQEAVHYLARAAIHRPDLSCLWKLIGDACTCLHYLHGEEDAFKFLVPNKLIKKDLTGDSNKTPLNKLETLQLGGRCYGEALKILPECAALWHDLGVNYLYQSECSIGENRILLAEKAAQILKKAICLDATNHKHWNALGVLCCFDDYFKPDLAQHCFIKSIQTESNNVVAWTNLATLYLRNDSVQLAHEAFKIAQSLEPTYVACWIGQAIIAEIVGHDDAMDLFRHTTELGHHIEGAIGYAHWVCSLLQDKTKHNTEMFRYAIEQMSAIPAASDALSRYLARVQTNPKAYNMHGLLLEHQKLYNNAAEAFKKAIDLLEKMEANSTTIKDLVDVRYNYARVLVKLAQYIEAIIHFQAAMGHDIQPRVEDMCLMGLALYRTGHLEQSYQVYTKAADIAQNDAQRSHVLTAIAMVTYKSGDVHGAKTVLFKSSQLSSPSIWGLEALCALGILNADVTLATAAAQELVSIGDSKDHLLNSARLIFALKILKGQILEGKRYLQKLLHIDPSRYIIWRLLAEILIRFFPDCAAASASCARCSIILDWKNSQECIELLPIGQMNAGQHNTEDMNNNYLSSAQKALHLYPDKAANRAMLAAAVHSKGMLVLTEGIKFFQMELKLLDSLLEQDLPTPLKLWVYKQSVVASMHCNDLARAWRNIDMLKQDFQNDEGVEIFRQVMLYATQQDATKLSQLLTQSACSLDLYYWQILVELYLSLGLKQEVELTIRHCLKSAQGASLKQTKLSSLTKLAHFMYREILKGVGDTSHLKGLFDEVVQEMFHFEPHNTVAGLMQAVLSLQDNMRLAKHQFQGLLSSSHHVTGGRGHDLSLARRALIHILVKLNKDLDLVQTIISEAEECKDLETLQFYQRLKPS